MSQALSPSFARCYGLARCARVEGFARRRLSLSQRDATEHERPSPWSSYVGQVLRLTLLAPGIVLAILTAIKAERTTQTLSAMPNRISNPAPIKSARRMPPMIEIA